MRSHLLPILIFCISLTTIAQEAYTLSPDSKLTIDGTSTVHDWTVSANTLEGSLISEGTSPKEIDFQVVVADIKSERGATMDKKMHAALQRESHPKVLFALKEVKNESTLVGMLTIGGNSQDVEITSKIDTSEGIVKISGEHLIALKDFNIEPPTAMFGQVIVGNDATVKFDLVFSKD